MGKYTGPNVVRILIPASMPRCGGGSVVSVEHEDLVLLRFNLQVICHEIHPVHIFDHLFNVKVLEIPIRCGGSKRDAPTPVG